MKQNSKLSYMILIFSLVIIISIINMWGERDICLFLAEGDENPKNKKEECNEAFIPNKWGTTISVFSVFVGVFVTLLGLNFFKQKFSPANQVRLYKIIQILTLPILPISAILDVLFHFAHKWAFQLILISLILLLVLGFTLYSVFNNKILKTSYFYIIGILLFFIILLPVILFFGEKQVPFQSLGGGFGAVFAKLKENGKSILRLIVGIFFLILSLYGYVNFPVIRTVLHLIAITYGIYFAYKRFSGDGSKLEAFQPNFQAFSQTFTNEVNVTNKSVFLILLIEIILLLLYFIIPSLSSKGGDTKEFSDEIDKEITTNKRNISELESELRTLKASSVINKIKRLLFNFESYKYELPMEKYWNDGDREEAWNQYIEGYKVATNKDAYIQRIVGKLQLPKKEEITVWTSLGIKTMTHAEAIEYLKNFSPAMEKIYKRINEMKRKLESLENENPVFETIYITKEPVRLDTKTTIIPDDSVNETSKKNYGFAISTWIYLYPKDSKKTDSGYKTIFEFSYPNMKLIYKENIGGDALIFTPSIESAPNEPNNIQMPVPNSGKHILHQKWNNIIINYDTERLDIFINGVLRFTKNGIILSPNHSRIGSVNLGENGGLRGAVKDIVYYPIPLTSLKISSIYNKPPPCTVPNCNTCISSTKCSICDSGYSLREDLTCMKD